MNEKRITKFSDPMDYFIRVTGGRWKLPVIFTLSVHGTLRYGALKRRLNEVTDKMLSAQLKEMEADGLLFRKQYDQIPPKVEYSLTEKGRSLLPIIYSMFNWGKEQMAAEGIQSDPSASVLSQPWPQP